MKVPMAQDEKKKDSRAEPTIYEVAILAEIRYATQFLPGWTFGYVSMQRAQKDALENWLDMRNLLDEWRLNPTTVFPPEPSPPAQPPEPSRYPVTLDQFLSHVLPKGLRYRTGDKYYIFRQFLDFRLRNPVDPTRHISESQIPRNTYQKWISHSQPGVKYWVANFAVAKPIPFDWCQPQILPAVANPYSYSSHGPANQPEPTKEDVDRYFALWKKAGIPDRDSFIYHRKSFDDWYQVHHAAECRSVKAENAYKRHAKALLRKHLWEKHCQANPSKHLPFSDFPEISPEQWEELLKLNAGKPLTSYKSWNYNIPAND
jgi:hypothetical protein